MGNCYGSKHKPKGRLSKGQPPQPQPAPPTDSTPRPSEWPASDIERQIEACELELKTLIATTEANPLPLHAEKPGIRIYGTETGRGFLMKSVWECQFSPQIVLQFTRNHALRLTWDVNLAECRNVSDVNPQISLKYERYNKILVVSARDLLTAGKVCPIDNGFLDVSVSVTIPEIPPVKGIVRAHLFVGGYHIVPTAQGSLVTLYNEMDFGGAIPRKLLVIMSAKTLTGWVEAFNVAIAQSVSSG